MNVDLARAAEDALDYIERAVFGEVRRRTPGDIVREVERLTGERDRLERQLTAVDEALPAWEPAPGGVAVGRVQTILNLIADREALAGLPDNTNEAG
jgi:hypothetical protein